VSTRRSSLDWAQRELLTELRLYLADGLRLARCRLQGGHEFGTWRKPAPDYTGVTYPHTWCRLCGWCQQTQSFDEERIGAIEGWYAGVEEQSNG
jgi:hypothetical protein